MKINIEQANIYKEVEITIKCSVIDKNLERLISNIRLCNSAVSGKKEGRIHLLQPEEILYFDTVDEKTFIYTSESVFETNLKLYEIEERFAGTEIIRVSKSTILNLLKISHITPLLNGRIEAVLKNDEKIIISRQYVPVLKKKLGL